MGSHWSLDASRVYQMLQNGTLVKGQFLLDFCLSSKADKGRKRPPPSGCYRPSVELTQFP